MITLFRKIRKKLIESGSITRYILYGIGEILLVVIGILIALQVNNWNEERKKHIVEKNFMVQLLEDARQDSVFFNSRLEILTENNNILQRIVFRNERSWDDTMQSFSKDSVIIFFSRTIHDSFLINNNPDPFEKVSDPELKEALRSYQNAHNYFSQATELLNRVIEEHGIELQLTYHQDINKIQNGEASIEEDFEFLKDVQIQAAVQLFGMLYENAINQLPELLERNSILIDQLSLQLK